MTSTKMSDALAFIENLPPLNLDWTREGLGSPGYFRAITNLTNPIQICGVDKRKLHDSCSSSPEIRKCESERPRCRKCPFILRLRISGSELQESCNFRLSSYPASSLTWKGQFLCKGPRISARWPRRIRMPRRFVFVLLVFIMMPAVRSMAQAKRPMTIDDLITTIRVSDPDISPDGKRVIFTKTTTALDSGRRNSDIWVVPSDGSAPPKLLIAGDRAENTGRFTPDGKRIAFISTRDGAPQIYVSDAEGRDAKPVTKLSGGVQAPMVIAPDSKKIAFVSDVFPQCHDEECNSKAREAAAKDPV